MSHNAPASTATSNENLQLSDVTLKRLRFLKQFARERARDFQKLSAREREVLTLICRGHTNESMAAKLHLSVHTIRTHRNNIWRNLGIKTVVDAVTFGQAFDLV